MGYDIEWLGTLGLDTQEGISFTGRDDKYISAVVRYYKSYDKNREKVLEYYRAGDLENLMITVHALKSNSKMIGAKELAAGFEALENACREGDTTFITENVENVLRDYEELIEKLKPLGETGMSNAPDEISAETAKEIVEELLNALDEFDDQLSKDLARKLSGYPFRTTQAGQLREAEDLIDDFRYDEAAEIIMKISGTIE